MCNCSNKRNTYTQQLRAPVSTGISSSPVLTTVGTRFQYTGKTALTVIGNITRKNYRFRYPGDIQVVDPRDMAGMMTIPVLTKK